MLRRLGDSGGARGDIQFVQDVGDVPVDRVLAETERCRDLFVAQSLSHETRISSSRRVKSCGSGPHPRRDRPAASR